MSINRWRCVGGTDEGCAKYQCLACYKTWEGRDNPEYCNWMFCPYCGSKWDGMHACLTHGEKYWSLPGYSESIWRKPTSFWLIEKRYHGGFEWSEWSKWEQDRILDSRYPAKHVHGMLRDLRAWAEHDLKKRGSRTEYRVSMIHKLPFPNSHVWYYQGC